jgi:hypothetical protein
MLELLLPMDRRKREGKMEMGQCCRWEKEIRRQRRS